ncbi:hypothetical protein [Micromonospora sp. NBRC 110038]|uniref:hypothetical protein n=1 Tax=Micromonospora sp. NBRC 110038 TaxID=1550034 RepID=UPI001E65648A|nr:hypothetical protein [Micromonospora sp. NBRC 110038]
MTGAPTVIGCPDCDGLTFRLAACRCARPDDCARPDKDPRAGAGGARQADPACAICQGAGSIAVGCSDCRLLGRRRAQFGLTVANLDTGAVASHRLVPGALTPHLDPAGGWVVELAPLVRELAATIGVAVGGPEPLPILLPPAWRPELPAQRRHELEALALVRHDHQPWRVLLGRSAPPPAVDPGARLARLCALADLLLLDLVIEVRRAPGSFCWDVRYELPGSPVPEEVAGWDDGGGLRAALARTDVGRALDGLGVRGRHAPAHLLRADPAHRLPADLPGPAGRAGLPGQPGAAGGVDLDQLDRRLFAGCLDLTTGAELRGAQAIWRDGRWWHTGLQPGDPAETLVEEATGQALRRAHEPLHRAVEPPDPSWWGEPIPWRPCPDYGGGHRIHQAAVVTLTDLRHRVIHLTWHAGTPEPTTPAGARPGGRPVVRLPGRYRLAAWAEVLGARPEDLTEVDGGFEVSPELCGGYVTLPWPGADPVAEHIAAAGPGLPAGRLIVAAAPAQAPPLAELIRLALGLDLACVVGLWDLRHLHAADPVQLGGLRWSVELTALAEPPDPAGQPCLPTVGAAVAYCLEYLENALAAAVPTEPEQPVPAPHSPAATPHDPVADPVPALERLAAGHAGQVVTVRFTRAGCAVRRHDGDRVRLLAEAADLPAALCALRLG